MNIDQSFFNLFCYFWLGIAFIVNVTMFFVTAPFGRHTKSTWGPVVNERLGWALMELPSFAVMAFFLLYGGRSREGFTWLLFAFWLLHYANRCFVFPLKIRENPRGMPLVIALSAILFNLVNSSINGAYLGELTKPGQYGTSWLFSPRFWIGFALFVSGLAINWISDTMLIRLRKPGESGYTLPRGFLFEYVASPNLSGEIVEWLGFAVMAWNLPALCFFVWTCANLIPRAKNHYDWSKKQFPDFPEERKILIPFLF